MFDGDKCSVRFTAGINRTGTVYGTYGTSTGTGTSLQ